MAAEDSGDDEAARRSRWEAAGQPLFGKVWNHDELVAAKIIAAPRAAPNDELQTPAGWPDNIKVDTGTWVLWLPDGWMQGITTNCKDKEMKIFMSPEGKPFHHMKDIAKKFGQAILKQGPKKDCGSKGQKKVKPVRFITDDDAVPRWPDGDWLPKEFKVCLRQLPTGLHTVFIPPGRKGEGCLFQRAQVLEYLSGKIEFLFSLTTGRMISYSPSAEYAAGKRANEESAQPEAKRANKAP